MNALPPSPKDSPIAWVEHIEKGARACRTGRVSVSREKVIKLCIMTRLTFQFIRQSDEGHTELARKHLAALVEEIDNDSSLRQHQS